MNQQDQTYERIDNSDLNALLEKATRAATGQHVISEKQLDPNTSVGGPGFRPGVKYAPAPGGGFIGYPADSKPEIVQKSDGSLLICEDGTAHFLTLWERLGLKAGFLTLEQLNDKYRQKDTQGG